MKVVTVQASEETAILTALIVHDRILAKLYRQIGRDKKPFRSKYSNIIARLCFDHYAKYQKAPGKVIESLFQKYARTEEDESAVELVEKLLGSLSERYKATARAINEQWTIDQACRYLEKIRLERTAEAMTLALEREDLEEAKRIQQDHKPLTFSASDWVDPFNREEMVDVVSYYEEDRSLVHFPGDLGKFLSSAFERGGFVSFVASEKKGKSFWLMEVVWQAIRQRRKVLYYVLGDMSKRQVLFRLYRRATLRPLKARSIDYPVKIVVTPASEGNAPSGDVEIEQRKIDALSLSSIRRAEKKILAVTGRKEAGVKLRCAGAGVVSASMIESDVEDHARQGWVPDLVVLDYADLLLPEANSSRQDFRHQIDESWKILRRISLDKDLCMVTATQASAKSYDAWLIRKGHFSEDKRKNAHVTAMAGINQTPEEKKKGIYRINWPFLRDGEWTEHQYVWVAGSLKLCAPALRSLIVR